MRVRCWDWIPAGMENRLLERLTMVPELGQHVRDVVVDVVRRRWILGGWRSACLLLGALRT